jgi:hypothetical protein
MTDPIPLIGDELAEIRAGTKAFFVWGGADYTDIFGERRFFIFKMKMSGHEHLSREGRPVWPLKPHPLGYEAN